MNNSRYYASAISAFAIWGLFSLALRPIKDSPPLEILFYRVIACLGLLLFAIFILRRRSVKETRAYLAGLAGSERKKIIGWNAVAGLLLTANWFLFIFVMNFVSVRATSLAYLVCPILTAVLAVLLLNEKMKRLQWLALAIGSAGCAMLALGHFYDLLLSILIALSYALYLIIQKKNSGLDNFVVLTFHVSIAVVLLLPLLPFVSGVSTHDSKFYVFILIIAVCFTVFPMFLSLYSLKGIKSSTVGMLMNINPIIAFALSVFYFKEDADAWQFSAYAIVFVSVVVFNIPALSRKKSDKVNVEEI